jgi:hypothetical protein
MPDDLFISYSRRDNERGQVTALKAQIESSFCAFAGRDLRVFFDTHEIVGMDDWRQKIQRNLAPRGPCSCRLRPQMPERIFPP